MNRFGDDFIDHLRGSTVFDHLDLRNAPPDPDIGMIRRFWNWLRSAWHKPEKTDSEWWR